MRFIKRAFFAKGWNRDLDEGRKALLKGQLDAAEKPLMRVLKRGRKLYGKKDPRRAEALTWGARYYHARWDERGVKIDRENWKSLRRALGETHPLALTALTQLVGYDTFNAPNEKEVRLASAHLGMRDSQDPAAILIRGKFALVSGSAEPLKQALKQCELLLARGVDPTLPDLTRYLAEVATELREHKLAAEFLRHSLRHYEHRFGARSAATAGVLHQLGQAHLISLQPEVAVAYLRKSHELHPDPEVAASLGGALQALGQLSEAKKFYQEYLLYAQKEFGPDSPEVARALHCMMTVHQGLEESELAESIAERLDQLARRAKKEIKAEMASRFRAYAHYLENGRGQDHLQRALKLTQKVHGKKHVFTALIRRDLAERMEPCRGQRSLAKAAGKRLARLKGDDEQLLHQAENHLARQLGYWANLESARGRAERSQELLKKAWSVAADEGLKQELGKRLGREVAGV